MTGVTVSSLRKAYGPLTVLHDIDLEVREGEFTVLLGPSGCGKSTLLSAIAGLDEIDGGTIAIGAEDVTDREPSKRGIAMVFQSYALYPTMTVRGNLSFGLKVKRLSKAEINRRVSWAAGLLQLSALLDRKPGQLSGGQRQRVAIGRALVQDAKLFLFDEPLSNLDAKLRTETRVEIKKLHKELGLTIVYVTHDQIEAMTLATRIAVMKGGKIEQYAAPEELYERPATLFVAGFIGAPAMNFLPGIVRAGIVEIGDLRLPLSALPHHGTPDEGASVILGVRPEHIGLAAGGAPGEQIDADTDFMEPMGADTLGWFTIGSQRLSARLPPQHARGVAGPTRLALDLSHASLFNADRESRY